MSRLHCRSPSRMSPRPTSDYLCRRGIKLSINNALRRPRVALTALPVPSAPKRLKQSRITSQAVLSKAVLAWYLLAQAPSGMVQPPGMARRWAGRRIWARRRDRPAAVAIHASPHVLTYMHSAQQRTRASHSVPGLYNKSQHLATLASGTDDLIKRKYSIVKLQVLLIIIQSIACKDCIESPDQPAEIQVKSVVIIIIH